jgi:hypothetical protein
MSAAVSNSLIAKKSVTFTFWLIEMLLRQVLTLFVAVSNFQIEHTSAFDVRFGRIGKNPSLCSGAIR